MSIEMGRRYTGDAVPSAVLRSMIDGFRGLEGGMESWSYCCLLGWHWEDCVIQNLCESSDYTAVYIHIHKHCKNTKSNKTNPSNKILKILEFENSQTKEGFPQTHRPPHTGAPDCPRVQRDGPSCCPHTVTQARHCIAVGVLYSLSLSLSFCQD